MILLQITLLLLLYGEGRGRRLGPHVTAPGTWRLGVPESVFIRAPQQLESFPVMVSVVSYPDKNRTFSSALLQLTPEKGFRGAVPLSVTLEDSPGRFVYLVVESEGLREETRIPVSSDARTPSNQPGNVCSVKRRWRRSLLSAEEIQELIKQYEKRERLQQCCLKGANYYTEQYNCNNGLHVLVKDTKEKCKQVAEGCCKYTQ
ncbi:hypothetical protein PRIEUP_LOCUS273, partial [Pristimantis euphronides]